MWLVAAVVVSLRTSVSVNDKVVMSLNLLYDTGKWRDRMREYVAANPLEIEQPFPEQAEPDPSPNPNYPLIVP